MPRQRRPIVPAAEAQQRIVDITIGFLREMPFDKVTARKITEAAGLGLPTIARNFGSMEGLFSHVCTVLLANATANTDRLEDLRLLFDPDFILRIRLIAWLLSEGSDPKIFRPPVLQPIVDGIREEIGNTSERTATTWINLLSYLIEGFAMFNEVHRLTQQEIDDAISLVLALRDLLPEAQKKLHWEV